MREQPSVSRPDVYYDSSQREAYWREHFIREGYGDLEQFERLVLYAVLREKLYVQERDSRMSREEVFQTIHNLSLVTKRLVEGIEQSAGLGPHALTEREQKLLRMLYGTDSHANDLSQARREVPFEIGTRIDAHGIAKGDDLRYLTELLEHGIRSDRMFYTAPLHHPEEARIAGAVGSGGPFDQGGFIIFSAPGKSLADGISGVAVNYFYRDGIPYLQKQFPHVTFVPPESLVDTLKSELQDPKKTKTG